MATERMRVLELIREGKVSVDEGVRLLEALGDEREPGPAPPAGERPLGEGFVAEIKANVDRVLSEETVEDLNKTVSKVVSAVTKTVGPRVRRDAASGRRRREERLASGWQPLTAEDGQVPISLAGRLLVESTGGGLVIVAQPAEAAPAASDSADEPDEPAAPDSADEDVPAVETPEAAAWAEAGESAPEASAWAAATAEQSNSESDGQPGAIATVEPLSEGRNWTWYALRRGADAIIAAYPTEAEDRHVPTLKVTVPARLVEIAARTVGGDIETERLDSPLDAQTRGGNIEISEHGLQPIVARTVGGNVSASGNPTQVKLRTGGGNVHFTGNAQELDGKTAGGNLRLTGRVERFNARTAGGNIAIEGARLSEGTHRARAAGGRIKVLLTEDSSVRIRAGALGGGIHVDLPTAEGKTTKRGPNRRYRGTLGEGTAELDVRSVGGSIEIGTLPTAATAD